MKNCLVCKTPVEELQSTKVKGGVVHKGICENKFHEINSKINESNSSQKIEDIQLLM